MTPPPHPPQQHAPPPHLPSPNPDAASSSSFLRRRGLPSDARGLRAAIKALSAASGSAAAAHAHAAKLGLDRDRTVRNALLTIYLSRGDRAAARLLFHGGCPSPRDVVSWTAMVTGHAGLGMFDEAASLFLAMFDDADLRTIDAVAAAAGFAACADAGDIATAREAHRRVKQREVALDVVARNALIDMYARCGDVSTARRWFHNIPPSNRNVVTWNTMISALTRAGQHADALAMFREMQQQRGGAGLVPVPPDDATLVAVLGACARLGALDAGRWVHAYHARRTDNASGAVVVVGNALIDMYAKCGAVDDAVAVFDGMPARDAYTYASTVLALATHGRAEDALALFASVPVRPNSVALLAALSACCHAGRVDEGLRLLRAMEAGSYDGVAPGVEHYGCAVDMLARAGRLDEAEALVGTMPVPPDALVRGSLLAACRARGDVERAERVMRWRVVGDTGGGGDEAGDHVLLANAYAARGRHGSAVRVRREMRKNRIVKDPGCSSIEIDGVVHEFRAVPANSISVQMM